MKNILFWAGLFGTLFLAAVDIIVGTNLAVFGLIGYVFGSQVKFVKDIVEDKELEIISPDDSELSKTIKENIAKQTETVAPEPSEVIENGKPFIKWN